MRSRSRRIRPPARRRRAPVGRARRIRRVVLALVVLTILAGAAVACSYTTDIQLPKTDEQSSRILAADGSLITTVHAAINREDVKLDEVAQSLQDAVVAIEDARFFEHGGVDLRGMLRALTRDVESGRADEGGSTITQQYVRNVLLDRDKTVSRKVREAVLAVQLERKYTKKQILERYLNVVYFGNGAYGVEAAARTYFDVDAKDLDLAQSALLAGLIQQPERLNPFANPAGATKRRAVVLHKMAELGKITRAQAAAAEQVPLPAAPTRTDDHYQAGHFVERVKDFVLTDPAFGATRQQREHLLFTGGLRIETTLDPGRQFLAEQSIRHVLDHPATDPQAALVSIDPATGYVEAYVGGPDFFGSQPFAKFDLAGQGLRQAGSSFKPFVLSQALLDGIPLDKEYPAPSSITIPIPGQQAWQVKNYEADESAPSMSLFDATVHSINTVYAQLIMEVGPQQVVDLATRMGVRSKLLPVPSAALGTNGVTVLDMASAYGTFADDGLHADPVFVTKVSRRDGTILYENSPKRTRVLPETTARQVTQVLQEVVNRGTAINARIGRPVAGKTGTAEEWHDAWFVGYVPQLVTAVWVGFPDLERPMTPPATRIRVTGGSWPAEIWQQYDATALAQIAAQPFPAPAVPIPTTTTAAVRAVPDVRGMPLADATRVLKDAGYKVKSTTAASRDTAPGKVADQLPAADTPSDPGTTVTLTVSTGPPRLVVVPSVLGEYPDQAAADLRALGLTVTVETQAEPPPGDPARAGRVWRQTPLAGDQLAQGQPVTITVNPTTAATH